MLFFILLLFSLRLLISAPRRFDLSSSRVQIMDERWESEIIEYGAINITGFRILDTHKRYVKEFLDGWRKLDATTSPGAGKEQISVSTGTAAHPALTNDL